MPTESQSETFHALYRAAAFEAVVARFESCRTASDPFAGQADVLQLAAQAYARLGKHGLAAETFLGAAALLVPAKSPMSMLCIHNAFGSLQRAGHHAAASWVALRSLSFPRACDSDAELVRHLVAAAITRRDLSAATAILAAASVYRSTRTIALETMLDLAVNPSKYGFADSARAPEGQRATSLPMLSIIVCSQDDERFSRFTSECGRAMRGSRYEIIRISDANSMSEGYNRGIDRSTGELLLFCHDDVQFITPDIHSALDEALSEFDLASCVGSSELEGVLWSSDDITNCQGWMVTSVGDGKSYSVGVVGVPNRLCSLKTGDGCLLACRRSVALRLRWDEINFDGFHFYDLDFCARASLQGYRLGVLRGLVINHLSPGSYDEKWWSQSDRFLRKYDLPYKSPAKVSWVNAPVETRAQAARTARNLHSWVSADWPIQLISMQASSFDLASHDFPALLQFHAVTADAIDDQRFVNEATPNATRLG